MNLWFWKRPAVEWLDLLPRRYRKYSRPAQAYGMTTDFELCLLETYGRDGFTGQGRIVDLGCWFGATTLSLARGLRANRRRLQHHTIEAMDLFEWEVWMEVFAEQLKLPRRFQPGESFFEEVQGLLRPYAKWVHLQKQDLRQYTPTPGPIEFLFIDAMKNWPLARAIAAAFFPALQPNVSYVVQQDFSYFSSISATNALLMWWLREHFECVHHVPYAHSVVFRCTQGLGGRPLETFAPELFTLDMIDAAYAYSLGCVSADQHVMVLMAKLGYLVEQGHEAAALALADQLANRRGGIEARMLAELDLSVQRRRQALAPRSEPWLAKIEAWAAARKSGK